MDHVALRAQQRQLTLKGVMHLPVRVAYTDVGEGRPQRLQRRRSRTRPPQV